MVKVLEQTIFDKLIDNIAHVYVGKKSHLALICMALACNGHILIEDVPGTGKTTLAVALAKSIGGSYSRISGTPDVMPSDIVGFSMFNQKRAEFEFRQGAIMANVFLVDEINRMPPKTQSGLLEAMQERRITIDNQIVALPEPFFVIATQNPVEYLGTYPLPEAQLDRFLIKLQLGYPAHDDERDMLERFATANPLDSLAAAVSLAEITQLQSDILKVRLKLKVQHYIIDLVNATRSHNDVLLGLSPRASLNLSRMARAHALYKRRDYVTPDDVKAIFSATCAHRIVPKTEAKYQARSRQDILNDVLARVVVQG